MLCLWLSAVTAATWYLTEYAGSELVGDSFLPLRKARSRLQDLQHRGTSHPIPVLLPSTFLRRCRLLLLPKLILWVIVRA
jgi:hypothetical protein